MAKNVLLIDRAAGVNDESFVEYILDHTNVNIPVLVTGEPKKKDFFKKNNRIEDVFSVRELDTYTDPSGLDFPIILEGRFIQNHVESALLRYSDDYNERKYIYYMGLSFWNNIFTKHNIDLIVINGYIHYFNCDGHLPIFAKKYNIPLITTHMFGLSRFNRTFQELNSRKMIKVENKKHVKDISEYLSWEDFNSFCHVNQKYKASNIKHMYFKNIVRTKLQETIGPLGMDVLKAVRYRNFHHKVFCEGTGFYTDTATKLRCYIFLMLTKKFLDKHSTHITDSAPFIYYSLHMEPEATVQYLTLESQLTAIQILASSLPAGWKIYVKEHPHQYNINQDFLYYYMHNINFFKTKKFYKRILKMKNVEIVSMEYSSEYLIERAIAIATLSGTVLLEAVAKKKPVLLFSEMHPLVQDEDVLKCFSFNQCMKNMHLLKNGYKPNYDNTLSVLNEYLSSNREDFFSNLTRIINCY